MCFKVCLYDIVLRVDPSLEFYCVFISVAKGHTGPLCMCVCVYVCRCVCVLGGVE